MQCFACCGRLKKIQIVYLLTAFTFQYFNGIVKKNQHEELHRYI